MIPWEAEFQELQARVLFKRNMLTLEWQQGQPMPSGLVREILKSLDLPASGVPGSTAAIKADSDVVVAAAEAAKAQAEADILKAQATSREAKAEALAAAEAAKVQATAAQAQAEAEIARAHAQAEEAKAQAAAKLKREMSALEKQQAQVLAAAARVASPTPRSPSHEPQSKAPLRSPQSGGATGPRSIMHESRRTQPPTRWQTSSQTRNFESSSVKTAC